MISWFRTFLLMLLFLPSCARITSLVKSKPAKKTPPPFGATGIPSQLRAGFSGGTPVVAGSNVDPSLITPANQIIWTDPDNPDAGIPELAPLMAASKKGVWEDNESLARQRAVREGKPLVILFTDSARNPACKVLAEELLDRKDFETWSKEKVVRLRADSNPVLDDPNLSMGAADKKREVMKEALEEMKKRYKILGSPAFVVLSPNGDVIGRYKGYKRGEADYTWGLLKQAEMLASKSGNEWRAGLMQKGYREWQDQSGNKVFARLENYSKGTVIFVEPDGRRSKTTEARLCASDRDWINQQKALRGIQ